jgi:hypothetical protein
MPSSIDEVMHNLTFNSMNIILKFLEKREEMVCGRCGNWIKGDSYLNFVNGKSSCGGNEWFVRGYWVNDTFCFESFCKKCTVKVTHGIVINENLIPPYKQILESMVIVHE